MPKSTRARRLRRSPHPSSRHPPRRPPRHTGIAGSNGPSSSMIRLPSPTRSIVTVTSSERTPGAETSGTGSGSAGRTRAPGTSTSRSDQTRVERAPGNSEPWTARQNQADSSSGSLQERWTRSGGASRKRCRSDPESRAAHEPVPPSAGEPAERRHPGAPSRHHRNRATAATTTTIISVSSGWSIVPVLLPVRAELLAHPDEQQAPQERTRGGVHG